MKPKIKASPAFSKGACYERDSFRDFLRREMKKIQLLDSEASHVRFETTKRYLVWVLARQRRYEKKPGGLGRK